MKEETVQLSVLTLFLLVYMLTGAAIFSAFERSNEKKLLASYDAIFHTLQSQGNISESLMVKFRTAHENACLLGVNLEGLPRWDYAGSFYFVGTVITTIGFGLTAPATFGGQLFFLFYAMLGIPLNILFMNTALEIVVRLLTSGIRKVNHYFPKSKFFKSQSGRNLPTGLLLLLSFVILIVTTLLLSLAFSVMEDWTFFEAVYFVIVACTTVGFGDYVPSKLTTSVGSNQHKGYRVGNWFLIGFGVVVVYVVLNLTANYFKTLMRLIFSKYRKRVCPCIITQVEPLDGRDRKGNLDASRANSHASVASEASGIDVGSFGAIQAALDKIRERAERNTVEGATELKALSTIEIMLKNEFKRVRNMQGNTPKARWQRAYSKAVRQHKVESKVRKSRRPTSKTQNLAEDGKHMSANLPSANHNGTGDPSLNPQAQVDSQNNEIHSNFNGNYNGIISDIQLTDL